MQTRATGSSCSCQVLDVVQLGELPVLVRRWRTVELLLRLRPRFARSTRKRMRRASAYLISR